MLDAMLIIFPAETESQNVSNISLAYCQCIQAQMTPSSLCKRKLEGEVVGSRSTGCVCNYNLLLPFEILQDL